MDFIEMIREGSAKTGSQAKLATALDVTPTNLSSAIKGRRGIPDDACAKLAVIIGIDYGSVSAARNAAMSKDKKQRDFWLPFVRRAVMTITGILIVSETTFLSPSPAEAAQASSSAYSNVYYVK